MNHNFILWEEKKLGLCLRSGNFSVLKISDISINRIIVFFFSGHGNIPVMHINWQGICFIDNEK